MEGNEVQDSCRICRTEATPEEPLYHPCICTGSIKFVHKECLLEWLKHSRNKYCEICKHRFSFKPIYSPDMPKRLPIKCILTWLLKSLETAVRFLLHYTIVAFAWLKVVPATSSGIYSCLFTWSLSPILSLPSDILSARNIISDCLCGNFVAACTFCGLMGFVWLVKEIINGRRPDWLEQEQEAALHDMMDPPEEFANNIDQPNAQQDGAQADVNNGNPIEWNQAAEELILRRFLGLDGLLVFLIDIFWLLKVNTFFIVVFAFCPYHIGWLSLHCFGFTQLTNAKEFGGLLTTLFGYINIRIGIALLHGAAAIIRLHKIRRFLGICSVVLKVIMMTIIKIGIFNLIGWWLDICSFTMLGATIQDGEAGSRLKPGTSMFIHYLAGAVYVIFLSSFISMLQDILRPGVLWFMNDVEDPNFSPYRNMIHSTILEEIRNYILPLVSDGTIILLVVWLPVNIIETLAPGFLPYQMTLSSESTFSDLILLILYVLLPFELHQRYLEYRLKCFVRTWCIGVSYILDIRSYLLGDVNIDEQQPDVSPVPAAPVEGEAQDGFQADALAAAHQEPFQPVHPFGFQPYRRPSFLPFKIACLIFFVCISLTLCSSVMITVPVFIGRKLISLWYGNTKKHELYAIVCGLHACSFMLEICAGSWISKRWNTKIKKWLKVSFKMLCAMSLLLGLIPIIMGLLFDVIILVPDSVSLNQTPVISISQDWAIGILFTTIKFCSVVVFGPICRMDRIIQRINSRGIRRMYLQTIFFNLALPVIIELGLYLSVPYIVACSIIPMFSSSFEFQNLVLRRIYPYLYTFGATVGAIKFLIHQFDLLYKRIKDDKYLAGKRLVNYGRQTFTANVVTPLAEENAASS